MVNRIRATVKASCHNFGDGATLAIMSAQRHRLSRGFLINEYRIDRVLGGGGFSLVYRAYHIRTQAKVVIKEFCPESLVRRMPGGRIVPLSDEAAFIFQAGIKRFFDEASALSKVHHPNIVRVSHVFRANETVYMVMDYERGTDLRAYIKRQSKSLSQRFLEACFPPLLDRKSTRLNSSHTDISRMPSSA